MGILVNDYLVVVEFMNNVLVWVFGFNIFVLANVSWAVQLGVGVDISLNEQGGVLKEEGIGIDKLFIAGDFTNGYSMDVEVFRKNNETFGWLLESVYFEAIRVSKYSGYGVGLYRKYQLSDNYLLYLGAKYGKAKWEKGRLHTGYYVGPRIGIKMRYLQKIDASIEFSRTFERYESAFVTTENNINSGSFSNLVYNPYAGIDLDFTAPDKYAVSEVSFKVAYMF